jgi:hypothetical protein
MFSKIYNMNPVWNLKSTQYINLLKIFKSSLMQSLNIFGTRESICFKFQTLEESTYLHTATHQRLLVVIKCIYLPPTYLHFIQDIKDRCLLLTSSTSFVDLPFQEHRMTKKHHMDQNPCISSIYQNKA